MGFKKFSEIFFLSQRICCDHSLELARRDGSNEGSQQMILGQIRKILSTLPLYSLLIWSTGSASLFCFSWSISSVQSYSSDEDTDDAESVIYPQQVSACYLPPKKLINRGRWTREEVLLVYD